MKLWQVINLDKYMHFNNCIVINKRHSNLIRPLFYSVGIYIKILSSSSKGMLLTPKYQADGSALHYKNWYPSKGSVLECKLQYPTVTHSEHVIYCI